MAAATNRTKGAPATKPESSVADKVRAAVQKGPTAAPAKSKKKGPTAEALARGSATKRQNSLFSKYLQALTATGANTKREQARIAELEELEATLARGTTERAVPLYTDKPEAVKDKKTGTTVMRKVRLRDTSGKGMMGVEQKPIKPHERAEITTRIAELRQKTGEDGIPAKALELRADFLKMLPKYAETKGYTVEVLRTCGVPETDLIECGIVQPAPITDQAAQ